MISTAFDQNLGAGFKKCCLLVFIVTIRRLGLGMLRASLYMKQRKKRVDIVIWPLIYGNIDFAFRLVGDMSVSAGQVRPCSRSLKGSCKKTSKNNVEEVF